MGIKNHSGNYRITSFQAAILRGQLAAFRKNAGIIHRHGLALDAAVAQAPGVKPLRRNPHVGRQCGYGFAFLYEKESFDGLSGTLFRKALSAELGIDFVAPYTPLNHSEVYYPHTKKRHALTRNYLKAITPERWKLPACEHLWRDGAIVTGWRIFGVPAKFSCLLSEAIAKIYKSRTELLKIQEKQGYEN